METDSHLSEDDEGPSGEDESLADARRRRFCNERQHDSSRAEPSQRAKRLKSSDSAKPAESSTTKYTKPPAINRRPKQIPRFGPHLRHHQRTRHLSYREKPHSHQSTKQDQSSVKKTYTSQTRTFKSTPSTASYGTVIHINPKFIQKFIEKSRELSSDGPTETSSASQTDTTVDSISDKTQGTALQRFGAYPRSTLQASAAMATIRLVTECIEDDSKRDEKMNKLLAIRLVEQLTKD